MAAGLDLARPAAAWGRSIPVSSSFCGATLGHDRAVAHAQETQIAQPATEGLSIGVIAEPMVPGQHGYLATPAGWISHRFDGIGGVREMACVEALGRARNVWRNGLHRHVAGHSQTAARRALQSHRIGIGSDRPP